MRRLTGDGSLPLAVVLHIAYTGYGVVRSLTSEGIPVVAFQKDKTPPEASSKLCQQLITFNDDKELLEKLVSLTEKRQKKPVLFITSDIYVEFFIRHRDDLEKHYLIHYPDSETVELLLSKGKFFEYAQRHDLPFPKSFMINSLESLNERIDRFIFPAIVKPFTKTPEWLAAKLEKAYLVNRAEELLTLYQRIQKIEPGILVQEWVPGPDSNVEYCLTYFDGESRCLASFTGAKIRQWPVGTGSTASTCPVSNELITQQTLALFKNLRYRGFGSVEYKKHEVNGKFYIMEPTVGRPNQQSYVATANGLNMPLIAYNSLTELNIGNPRIKLQKPVFYIDEWGEIGSVLVHLKRGHNCLWDFFGLLNKRKSFRYYDPRDKQVFISSCIKLARFAWRRMPFRLLRKGNNK